MVNKSTSIYKIFWFISCCLWASPVAAVDVLNQGDVLNSSASLVSRNKLFTLRFFNLSSNYSYLGIFYTSDTNPGKPFWIANRDKPITDNSGALVINETGKLMITFNGGKALLELFSSQLNNKVSAILQDDGNFVLKSGEQILWQSFDFPTDSFLPGMKLGINYTNQSCRSRGESFQQEKGYYPDSVNSLHYDYGNVSLSDCKDICWKNCTCVGTDVTSLNPNGTGCKFWYGPLNQEHFNGSWYYIIRPAPPAPPVEWWKWAVIAVAATIVIAIILVILFLFFMRWRRARFEEKFLLELMNEAKELEIEGRKCFRLKVYSVSSIMDATNCFSHENKLGEGGYGPVYKGLLDGQEIAIKRLSRSSRQGLVEFKNELIIVAKLQHTNLVQLLGFCIQGEEKMLVYEYMPYKSLDSYIFDQSKRKLLNWNKYFNIIEEIAQGILYLHKYSRFRIIHRDLKAGNILLDKNMNPKISDFGLARIFTTAQSEANTNRIVGTRGYMPPEYAVMGIFSTKSDVFSYGVLVLEIVSGRRSNSNFNFDRPLNLIGYAWMLWKEDAALELMHPTLRDSCSEDRVLRCINVALLCVEDNPLDRPSMSDVIFMLTSESIELSMPKQPAFCIERRVAEVNSSTASMAENRTINNLTVSVMTGR